MNFINVISDSINHNLIQIYGCSNRNLKRIDISSNLLMNLNCSFNQITNLDNLSEQLVGLVELNCSYNRITSLDNLPKKLKILDCSGNKIK